MTSSRLSSFASALGDRTGVKGEPGAGGVASLRLVHGDAPSPNGSSSGSLEPLASTVTPPWVLVLRSLDALKTKVSQ